jgi:hypothetical protein
MAHIRGAARSVAVAVCFLLVAAVPAYSLPPAEVCGQLPAISQPSLSPDGKHLATIQPY